MGNYMILYTLLFISHVAVHIHSENLTNDDYGNRNKLNFSLYGLKQRCESKLFNISQILEDLHHDFNKEWSEVSKKLWDINIPENVRNTTSGISSSYLLKSQCFEKSNFGKILEDMIGVIQVCFGSDLHLKKEEIQNLSRSAVSRICSYLESDSLIKITDNQCADILENNKDCFSPVDNMSSYPDYSEYGIFRNLRLDNTLEECNSLIKIWECQENVVKLCKNSSVKIHTSLRKKEESFTGCRENYNTTTDEQSGILDMEKGRFNFTIPELIRICESKGIDLKEKTRHANFHVFDLFMSCSGKIYPKNVVGFPNGTINCMKEQCYSNQTLQLSFERIIDLIQSCFEDVERISLKSKENLARTSVEAFCDKMLMGELAFTDPAGTYRSLENCYERLEEPEEEVSKFFVLLSVPHIYTPKQCSYYAGLFACAQEEFRNSCNETKAAIEAVRLRLSDCNQLPSIFT